MRIFVDVDGTLTKEQRANSIDKSEHWTEMIDKVKKLQSEGHEIIIWSGSTKYAEKVGKILNIKTTACVGKPELIIDNQKNRWGKRLKNRTILPEEFLAMDFNKIGAEK
jgi:hydroxymethylpyrimidine pyrophosphatase-like HAD family hydrolase